MQAIAIATVNAKCIVTLAASITEYVPRDVTVYLMGSQLILPRHRTVSLLNEASNFGDAYNTVVKRAFEEVDEVVVCNDDIVFTPYTWQTLAEDVSALRSENIPLGWVACRSDYARGYQNIRLGEGRMEWFKYASEHKILETDIIAPICAYIHKSDWIDFLPLNWYSDDVQCLDMQKAGKRHFISRAYVHHVGSQTCGFDATNLIESAKPVIKAHRPDLYDLWFRKTD
jgi:hypothetical protein